MGATEESLKSSPCDGNSREDTCTTISNSPLPSPNSTSGYSETSFKSLRDDMKEECVDFSLITFNDDDELPDNFKSLLSKPIVSPKNSFSLKGESSQKSATVDDDNSEDKRKRVKFLIERTKCIHVYSATFQ